MSPEPSSRSESPRSVEHADGDLVSMPGTSNLFSNQLPSSNDIGRNVNTPASALAIPNKLDNIFLYRAQRIKFYANGDKNYQPLVVVISRQKYRSFPPLLQELTRMFADCRTLRNGVRYVFNLLGEVVNSINMFFENCFYICSSTENFINIDYAVVARPIWRSTAARDAKGKLHRPREFNLDDIKSTRQIFVVRNEFTRPRRITEIILYRESPLTLQQVLERVGTECKCTIKALYGKSGRTVFKLCDLFDTDDVFFASHSVNRPCREDFRLSPAEDRKLHHMKSEVAKQRNLKKQRRTVLFTRGLGNRYKIIKMIGSGSSCSVYYGKDVHNGRDLALKLFSEKFFKDFEQLVMNEVEMLNQLSHENIVQLVEFTQLGGKRIMIMDFYPLGDLFLHLQGVKTLSLIDSGSVVKCTATALEYLHTRDIIHRDVKPENLLVYDYNPLRVKLTDFGLAVNLVRGRNTFGQCGTLVFAAPEVFSKTGYNQSSDIWSLGVVAYITVCGYPPFDIRHYSEIDKPLKSSVKFPSPAWDNVPAYVKVFMLYTIDVDIKARFTAKECMEYFWVANPSILDEAIETHCQSYLSRYEQSYAEPSDETEPSYADSNSSESNEGRFSIEVSSVSFSAYTARFPTP